MNRRELAIILIFLVLAVIQASLMPHLRLAVWWFPWLNIVDVSVAVIALFEKRKHRLSWVAALCGGIFLDMYSTRFFGFWIALLLGGVAFIKFLLKKYVRIPSFW